MKFRCIRSRGTILRTVYDKNKGQTSFNQTNEQTFTKNELRKISAQAVNFATKQIASELTDDYNLLNNIWNGFNITSLTTEEKLYLSYLNFDPFTPVKIIDYSTIVGTAIKQSKLVTQTLFPCHVK